MRPKSIMHSYVPASTPVAVIKKKKIPTKQHCRRGKGLLGFQLQVTSHHFRDAKAETHAANHMTPIVKSGVEGKHLCGLLACLALN